MFQREMEENFKLKEKVLIIGSSNGIGKALAVQMARDGYELILHASKQEGLDSLILRLPISCRYNILIADFTTEASVLEFLNTLKKKHNDITGIISSEGINMNKSQRCKFLYEINDMLLINQNAANTLVKPI